MAGGESAEDGTAPESARRWLIKTLAMPAAICIVPLLFELFSHAHDERENQFRLYTELLSKREEADMNVRRGIFDKVFDKYLPPDDLAGRRLQLQLSYSTRGDTRQILVWANLYDFPLMNFARISDEERVAIVLTRLDAESKSATVTLVYYPSSRSGTKDKPYIDDVMSRLGRP